MFRVVLRRIPPIGHFPSIYTAQEPETGEKSVPANELPGDLNGIKNNMTQAIAFVLFLGILLSGCSAPHDNLIIPGKRVGSLVINHTKTSEVGVNGSVADKYNDQALGISFGRNMRIDGVEVTRPNYKTKELLTVGDTEQAIVNAYGKGEIVSIPIMAGNVQKAIYSNHALHYPGIRWVIGKDGKVTSIIVSAD